MSQYLSTKVLASLLMVALIAPSTLFIAPQRAHATGWPVFDAGNFVQNTLAAIKSVLIEIHTYTSAVAEVAMYVNTFIFQPLLYVLSGRLLKSMTAGVLGFVNGLSNGAGRPQFVQNLGGNLQGVGDASAFAFFDSYIRNMGSPFASSIVHALRIDYVRRTSLAGFYGANRDTLSRTSPNIRAYLAGDWSQGGLASWFALTTQDNNNPYMMYLNGQSQRDALVGQGAGGAKGKRKAELAWGNGMLSWCGVGTPVSTGPDGVDPGAGAGDGTGVSRDDPAYGTTAPLTETSFVGTVPGDPCVNKDGTSGKVKTPGSVIGETLNKVLGSTQDKIVQMGALASEVNGIMGDITKIMQTVNIAKQILSGPDDGGLAGANSRDDGSYFLSVSSATVYQSVAESENTATNRTLVTEKTHIVDQYESSWLTIKSSADFALASVNALTGSCTATAQTALTTNIQPALARAASAAAVVAVARVALQKIQDKFNVGADATADIQALNALPPSSTDVTNALQDAQVSGDGVGATADPAGSLTVSGGSLVDRMNLIRANATTMVCTP
jgi:hypothetical protein